MYTVNALMHQSMSPVELYDMNSPQMEELLSYYFNSLNRLENAQPETRCSNSFDVKVTKTKHDVGGRKVKGISGTPAQSKQAGIEQVSQNQALNIIYDLMCFSARKRCSKSGNCAIVQVE